ncbi:MAG: hypothetical protein WA738_01420 [Candidatus Angelobacter sp.]
MRPNTLFLLTVMLVASHFAFSQTEISDPGAKQVCASVQDVEIPTADRPSAAEEKTLTNCSSVDAYFGLGQPADPVKARQCAYAQIDRGDKTALGGRAILMMVYANGMGAPRNFDVALKFACTIGDAPGDAAGRVYQIVRYKKANWAGSNFSVCDHSSGREMYEQCAILQERFDKPERDQKLQALAAAWNAKEKKAFRSLLEEADRFFKVQANNGVNLEASFEIQEEIFLRNNMITSLEQFERGELPKFSADDFHLAETAENAAYQRTQNGDVSHWGTITRESVKHSEEEWHRYAGAWISFGKEKYPGVTEQSWKTWLDQERVVMFQRFLR